MSTVSVSILITNFNYARFLVEAINSALEQTYSGSKVQVVVVDDGSTDQSCDVIKRYTGRITPVFKDNGGEASAVNAGFEACEGDIVCMLDADDYFFPEKVEEVVKAFHERPSAGWHFHTLPKVMDGCSNAEQGSIVWSNRKLTDYRLRVRGGESMPLLPATSGLSFRRDVLKAILPMPVTFRTCADAFLRLAAISDAPGLLSPQELAVHRIHGNNLFEGRNNADVVAMHVDIWLSDAIQQCRPFTKPFTDRLFAHAIGRLAAYKGWRYTLSLPEVSSYLQSLSSPKAKLRCANRAIFNWVRCYLQHL